MNPTTLQVLKGIQCQSALHGPYWLISFFPLSVSNLMFGNHKRMRCFDSFVECIFCRDAFVIPEDHTVLYTSFEVLEKHTMFIYMLL